MVEDPELPFPESVAASEIHKAGQRGAKAAKYLFWNIGVGGLVYMLGRFGLFASDHDFHFSIGTLGKSQVRLGTAANANALGAGGSSIFAGPEREPGVPRSRLHYRRAPGFHSVCWQRFGMGAAGSTSHFLPRTANPWISTRGHSRQLGHAGCGGLEVHRASHSRWWDVSWGRIHVIQNA